MNNRQRRLAAAPLALLLLVSCAGAGENNHDLVNHPFSEAQAELREVVESMRKNAMTANVEGLQGIHLVSDKFTKFGPRSFERQDVASTNESEAAFFSSVAILNYEARELKIDVFGDIGIVTYYPHVSFVQNGESKKARGRQTLVFLNTADGWRIVHEHGTPEAKF